MAPLFDAWKEALKTRAPCEVAALDEVTGAAGPQVKGGKSSPRYLFPLARAKMSAMMRDGSSTGATFAGSRQQAASF